MQCCKFSERPQSPLKNMRLVSLHSRLKGILKHIFCIPLNTAWVSKQRSKHFYLTLIWKISFAKNGKFFDKLENMFSLPKKSKCQFGHVNISRLSAGEVSRTANQPKAPDLGMLLGPLYQSLSHLSVQITFELQKTYLTQN